MRFPSFSKDFRGVRKEKNPCFLGGEKKKPCFFPKSKGWRVRVRSRGKVARLLWGGGKDAFGAQQNAAMFFEEERRCNTGGGKPSESLEALRGSFFSRNSHRENLREVLLEALGFFQGLSWSLPFVVAPPISLDFSHASKNRNRNRREIATLGALIGCTIRPIDNRYLKTVDMKLQFEGVSVRPVYDQACLLSRV